MFGMTAANASRQHVANRACKDVAQTPPRSSAPSAKCQSGAAALSVAQKFLINKQIAGQRVAYRN